MTFGINPLPINWLDWRFGFVVRQAQRWGRDVQVSFGPFALEVFWRNYP